MFTIACCSTSPCRLRRGQRGRARGPSAHPRARLAAWTAGSSGLALWRIPAELPFGRSPPGLRKPSGLAAPPRPALHRLRAGRKVVAKQAPLASSPCVDAREALMGPCFEDWSPRPCGKDTQIQEFLLYKRRMVLANVIPAKAGIQFHRFNQCFLSESSSTTLPVSQCKESTMESGAKKRPEAKTSGRLGKNAAGCMPTGNRRG